MNELEISNQSKVAQRLDDDERTKFELGRAGETIDCYEPPRVLAEQITDANAQLRLCV